MQNTAPQTLGMCPCDHCSGFLCFFTSSLHGLARPPQKIQPQTRLQRSIKLCPDLQVWLGHKKSKLNPQSWRFQILHGVKSSWVLVTRSVPRAQFWGQPCLMSLLTMWTMWIEGTLSQLGMTVSLEGEVICWRAGRSWRGIWTGWIVG